MSTQQDNLRYLDLFAGAGGLSEGFIRAGFKPVAHVEANVAACYTLKTRTAFHWLRENERPEYDDYLHGKISRRELYALIPDDRIASVINLEISENSLAKIFHQTDQLLDGKRLDLIIGGPPCQAYSLAGRSRDKNGMKGDRRNYLYFYYAEFLKHYKPAYFIFENVTGLLSAKDMDGTNYLESMKKLFSQQGYAVVAKVINSGDYGVLQNRRRVILTGNRYGKHDYFPLPENWQPDVTAGEVFKDLPSIKAGEGKIMPQNLLKYAGQYLYDAKIRDGKPVTLHMARPHNDRDLEIYRMAVLLWNQKQRLNYCDLPDKLKTHKNQKSFTDRFKVVAADIPLSHTIVAHIAKDGHYYIHPDIRQNRSITPREAARFQSFPDNYFFESVSEKTGRSAAFCQIGNAVPVLLAEKIAEKLRRTW